MMNRIAFLLLLGFISPRSFSQTPSDLYLKTLNSYVAGSPEASQIMKYQDYPINLFTGTPQIGIPVYTLTGKGIAVPISISYHAGGGVKVDELATKVGLGWSLSAGGEITREIRGGEDEGGSVGSTGSGTSGFLNKPHPMYYYKGVYDATVALSPNSPDPNQQIWVEAMNGHLDLEPDMFYFSFGGYSGKFLYDDSLSKFICLTENSHLDISFDHSSNLTSFKIVTDDGNKYYFANRETSKSMTQNMGPGGSITPWTGGQTTSWKLSKIVNADATDSILFNYTGIGYQFLSGGTSTTYQALWGPARNPVQSFSTAGIDGQTDLVSIVGTNSSITFVEDATNRIDLSGINKALSKIIIKDKESNVVDIFVLHHSYFQRSSKVGPVPAGGDIIMTSLRLDSVSQYGNAESNPYPLRHAFTYDDNQLPARLSYAKDWWGYANYNDYANSLVPATIQANGVYQPGADRHPDLVRMHAGILKRIRLPTGGTVSYEYEPNTTTQRVPQAAAPENMILNIAHKIMETRPPHQGFADSTITFTVNEAANGETNSYSEGVDATISYFPIAPGTIPPSTDDQLPYFTLRKTHELNGAPAGSGLNSFERTYQWQGMQQEHLPNGRYEMKFIVGHYNQHLPTPPMDGDPNNPNDPANNNHIQYFVTYKILDTSGAIINYNLAGLRVKSITTKDQFSNITNTRNFLYHKPENDSSYGRYIGQGMHAYFETTQSGQWQVKMGSSNMPGWGNEYASVIYPKVIEDVTETGVTYRTEHYYTKGLGIFPMYSTSWPFFPVDDIESMRGNEYMTVWNKYNGPSDFTPAKVQYRVFDSLPKINAEPTRRFGRMLYGIKCAAASYDQNTVVSGGYAPPYVSTYFINAGYRSYLASDTVTTYDLNNAYQAITTWNDYKYGDYGIKPVIARTGNSDGTVSIQKDYFALDRPDADALLDNDLVSGMVTANRINMPLATKNYKDGQLLSRQYTYGHVNANNQLLVDSVQQAILSNTPETEVSVLEYDGAANPLTIELRGGKYRKYLWNIAKNLPLATCVMSENGAFAFTSFEYPNEYSWNENSRVLSNPFSGKYAYDLSGGQITASFPQQPQQPFGVANVDVYVWATADNFTINNQMPENTGKTKGSYTLYTAHIVNALYINLKMTQGATASLLVDQLVAMPTGSDFQGNVYDSYNRITAAINNLIETSFYEYDSYGRLSSVKDEKGNILKASSYQYQGPQ